MLEDPSCYSKKTGHHAGQRKLTRFVNKWMIHQIFASEKLIVITQVKRNGNAGKKLWRINVWEVSKVHLLEVNGRKELLNAFQSGSYLLSSNLGHWSIVFPCFSSFNVVLCVLFKKYHSIPGQDLFQSESSDSHVLVYKLLTALGFVGMKDALFIVLWDERCIIYNSRITILFTLVMLKSHSCLVMELQNPF